MKSDDLVTFIFRQGQTVTLNGVTFSDQPRSASIQIADDVLLMEAAAQALEAIDPALHRSVDGFGLIISTVDPGDSRDWPPDLAGRFLVRRDGAVYTTTLSLHDTTLGDIRRAAQLGYIARGTRFIRLQVSEGRGGDGGIHDVFTSLTDQGVPIVAQGLFDVAVYYLLVGRKQLQRRWVRHSARKVIPQWMDNRMASAHQLRRWLDTREVWTVKRVQRGLKLAKPSATLLLVHNGYLRRSGTEDWVLSQNPDALRRRYEWDNNSLEYWDGDIERRGQPPRCRRHFRPRTMAPTIEHDSLGWRCPACGRLEAEIPRD